MLWITSRKKPMASVCISNRVNDTRVPLRPTFANLYRWPESDVEFVKTVNSCNMQGGPHAHAYSYGLSRRQMYLRSYTFSTKKVGVTEKTIKYLKRLADRVVRGKNRSDHKGKINGKIIIGRAKDVSYAVLFSIFHRMLSCSAKFDVANHHDF